MIAAWGYVYKTIALTWVKTTKDGRFENRETKESLRARRFTSEQRITQGSHEAAAVSLSDAILQAIRAYPQGVSSNEILSHLSREFGMAVRPNHLGIVLQRHRRAGRLENRDQRWFMPGSAQREQSEQPAITG